MYTAYPVQKADTKEVAWYCYVQFKFLLAMRALLVTVQFIFMPLFDNMCNVRSILYDLNMYLKKNIFTKMYFKKELKSDFSLPYIKVV